MSLQVKIGSGTRRPFGPREVRVAISARLASFLRDTDTPAFLASAVLHAVFLLILALCVVPGIVTQNSVLLDSNFTSEHESLEILSLDELDAPAEFTPEDERFPEVQTLPSSLVRIQINTPFESHETEPSPFELNERVSLGLGDRSVSPAEIASEASTVEGAVDTVTAQIKGRLERGDLLVIWLLDASHSLVDDRRRVADQLEPFFSEIAARRGQGHRLTNAVVSFGKSMRQRVAPTNSVREVVKAVEKLPIDRSGKENVFAAVSSCARQYRQTAGDSQVMVVVWTDETGDDTDLIEDTIEVCESQRVVVSVVGPSSVLGAETGLHSYRDPKTKDVFQLPIKKGPDSALSERIDLGYWFLTRPPGRTRVRWRDVSLPSWYGGHHLKGIASGFSPHALTRLAAQTGGAYTIFDRPEDRGPFRPEAMREYAPEYQSKENYLISVSSHPLRRAVHNAVQVTQGRELMPPEFMLFVVRDDHRPFSFERPYLTPAAFARKLRARRRALQRSANRQTATIEKALAHLSADGTPDGNLEAVFSQESSPRWRAWYDLTRGRLLATSVRLEEYRLALDQLAEGGLLGSTNHVILMPSPEMRSGLQERATEAERLLRRCAAEHAGTPWANLAERELVYGLGIFIRQMSLDPVPTVPAGPQAKLPNL